MDGTRVWEQPGEPDKLYFVHVGTGGKNLLALALPNRRVPPTIASLYDIDNSLIWMHTIDGVDVSGSVSSWDYTAAISYKKQIKHGGKEVPVRYVTFIGRSGSNEWEKGGIFFQPKLISFTRDGLLVYDDLSVYSLDLTGKVNSKVKLPARVRLCRTDSTGNNIVLYCGDGNLYCIKAKSK